MIDFNDILTHKAPPSAEVLAQVRRRLTQQKTALERRKQQILRLSWASICLGLILMGVSSYFGWPVVLAVAVAVVGVVSGAMAMAGAGAMAMVVSGAGVGFVVVAMAVVVSGTVDVDAAVAGVVVAAIAGVAIVVAYPLFEKHIEEPLKANDATLTDLVELDATDKPDECIQLDEWREQDKTINAFLTALMRLGRKPVVGEYRAAKEWMENAERRQAEAEKLERARQACARFDSQVSVGA